MNVKRKNAGVKKRIRKVRTSVSKVVKKTRKSNLRKFVKKVVEAQEEVKTISKRGTKQLTTLQLGADQTDVNVNSLILTPVTAGSVEQTAIGGLAISQGTADGQRVGVKIRPKKVMLNIALSCNPYNASTNAYPCPYIVRMYFYRIKLNPSTIQTTGAVNGSTGIFFQDGTTQTGFIGTLADLNMKINSDRFTYIGHHTFKLGYANYAATGSDLFQYFANNDYKLNVLRKINITKYCPKIFQWDDAGTCVTPYLHCIFQVVPATGTVPFLEQLPVQLIWDHIIEYTDA